MAWIKLYSETTESAKLSDLATRLGITEVEAMGHLVFLWAFTERNAWATGDLGKWAKAVIAKKSGWTGSADGFVLALQQSGWLNSETMIVHEWTEHQAELIRIRSRHLTGRSTDKVRTNSVQSPVKVRESRAEQSKAEIISITTYAKPVAKAPDMALGNIKSEIPVEPALEPESGVLAACQKIKNISPAMLASWRSTYPSLDIVREIQKADCWAVANQKVCSRWGRFVNNWLKNAQKGPKDTGHGKVSENATSGNLDALAVALTECWLENQTGKAPDKATAEATCKLYYNDIKMYLDLWRGDMDGAAAFLAEFAQEKRKQGYNRWPMSWATKAAALKVAEKEAER